MTSKPNSMNGRRPAGSRECELRSPFPAYTDATGGKRLRKAAPVLSGDALFAAVPGSKPVKA